MSHCDIRSPEGLYHNGEWDEDALSRAGGGDPAQTVLKTDAAHVTKNDMNPELTVYNAACGRHWFFCLSRGSGGLF